MKALGMGFFAALLGFAACGKSSDCKKAVHHLGDLVAPTLFPGAGGQQARATFEDALAGVCEKDKWPADMVNCVSDAATIDAAGACESHLTPEQRKSSDDAVSAAMKASNGAGKADHAQLEQDDVLKQITDQRDRLCACKDAACAETINKEWDALKVSSEHARHDKATSDQFDKIDDARFACYQKIAGKK